MKTVISASRRTDIPAFYLDWFIDRINQGVVEVRNPFYPQNTKRVSLTPDQVEWIVFWSRNYGHFLKKRQSFEAYQLFFHFTIVSPSILEKSPMPIARQLNQLEQLVNIYGAQRIIWRYDPLVFWRQGSNLNTNFSEKEFEFLAKTITGFGIKSCTISVAHPYAKFEKRLKNKFSQLTLIEQQDDFVLKTVSKLLDIAQYYHLEIKACCTDFLLKNHNIHKAACIDGQLLNQLSSNKVSEAKTPTRPECVCTKSIDIGDYRRQPCYFGCLYCYANPVWK